MKTTQTIAATTAALLTALLLVGCDAGGIDSEPVEPNPLLDSGSGAGVQVPELDALQAETFETDPTLDTPESP